MDFALTFLVENKGHQQVIAWKKVKSIIVILSCKVLKKENFEKQKNKEKQERSKVKQK